MDKVRLDFPGVFLSISLLFETVGLSLSVLGLLPFLPVQKSLEKASTKITFYIYMEKIIVANLKLKPNQFGVDKLTDTH